MARGNHRHGARPQAEPSAVLAVAGDDPQPDAASEETPAVEPETEPALDDEEQPAQRPSTDIGSLRMVIEDKPAPRLLALIESYDRGSPEVFGRLENLRAALGDLLHVASTIPAEAPAEIRAALAAVVERI